MTLEPERLYALLWHFTEGRLSFQEFWHHHHDWFLANIIFRPNAREHDESGGYWPVERGEAFGQEVGPVTMFMMTTGAALKKAGWTDEAIKARCEDWLKSYQGVDRS